MKTVNIYEAKTNLSKLLELVQNGEEVVIAKAGKPIADLKPHQPKKNKIKFGFLGEEMDFKDEDLVGIDPDIQEMFYGKDWDKQ
jgi:prevent-host-death family protein